MNDVTLPRLPLDRAACHAAMAAHDARFDGRFFCGVSSTGIYCRPICRVKLPKLENCAFFPSAAAAEAAGYRPCLRCRPELAPGLAPVDAVARTARRAAAAIEEDCLPDGSIALLAATLGVSDRHLRRVFLARYGVAPVQYLQTQRLLLAKNLLTDTRLTVTEAAMAAGFGSIRRFNHTFKEKYRLTPGSIRKESGAPASGNDAVTLLLAYRPPYAWDRLLAFLSARAVPKVEAVTGGFYRRTAALGKDGRLVTGWIQVAHRPERNALAVTVAGSLLPVLPAVLARIRHLFDLNCEPAAVEQKLATLAAVAPGLPLPGIRLPGCFDPFEMAVRAVLGQQITVRAAGTLAARMAESFGGAIATPFAELSRTFPSAAEICALPFPIEDRLGPLGVIGSRARSILALAKEVAGGRLPLSPSSDRAETSARLRALPGFGPWTADYLAMRALGWPDTFLEGDCGVKKALSRLPAEEVRALQAGWSPWRSYATVTLWESLRQSVKNGSKEPGRKEK